MGNSVVLEQIFFCFIKSVNNLLLKCNMNCHSFFPLLSSALAYSIQQKKKCMLVKSLHLLVVFGRKLIKLMSIVAYIYCCLYRKKLMKHLMHKKSSKDCKSEFD